MSADHAKHPEKDRPASAEATHHRHTCAGSLPPAVRDQSQPHRFREQDSTRPNLRRSPPYRRSRFDAQVDSKTFWRLSFGYSTPISSATKRRAEIPHMGVRIDSANGKAPDEVIIGWAFNTLPRGGFTALCVIGKRAL